MFAIDIRSLGGTARRKNGSEEEMTYHMIHYNLQVGTQSPRVPNIHIYK